MTCKHNRIIKELRLTDIASSDLGLQYMEVYVCAHCGEYMKCEPIK